MSRRFFENRLAKERQHNLMVSDDLKTMPRSDRMCYYILVRTLNLGIEWNGIVHFKPIYGQAKLDNIQKRDTQKQKIAQSKGIHLIIVPDLVSTRARVREAFIDICKIIRSL